MADSQDFAPEKFGPYLVYEKLGMGGMAVVHRAVKQGIEGFQRTVALKRLLSHLVEDPHFVKSFVREARLASMLQHANCVQIYDLGLEGDTYYIAMEYLRGRDLRKILRQARYATGAPPIPFTVALMSELLDGLEYAHNLCDEAGRPLGIIHRDVSPSNAIVAMDGHLKIIDFGIAKASTPQLRTRSGHIKGKFAYMSPETMAGDDIDGRADVFSAGVVAWELLTARPLFAGRTDYETIQKVRTMTVPPPSEFNKRCPDELDQIVLMALAKDPEERWASAGAMRSALDTVSGRYSVRATNREIAQWIEWAFEQPRIKGSKEPPKPAEEPPVLAPRRRTMNPFTNLVKVEEPPIIAPLDAGLDEVSIEIVWGKDDEAPEDVVDVIDLEPPKKTLPTGMSTPATRTPHQQSGQTPLPHHQSGQTPLPHQQSGQTPLPHHQSGQTPLPHHQSGQTPLPHHQSGQTPLPHHQSGQNPLPSDSASRPTLAPQMPGSSAATVAPQWPTGTPPGAPPPAADVAKRSTAVGMAPPPQQRSPVEDYIAQVAEFAPPPVGASPLPSSSTPSPFATQPASPSKQIARAQLPPSAAAKAPAPRASEIRRHVEQRKAAEAKKLEEERQAEAAREANRKRRKERESVNAPREVRDDKTEKVSGDFSRARITTDASRSSGSALWYVVFAIACAAAAAGGFIAVNGC